MLRCSERKLVQALLPALAAMCLHQACLLAQDSKPPEKALAPDPFADVTEAVPKAGSDEAVAPQSWWRRLFQENFGFRKEVMSQFDTNQDGHLASRQSIGFEALKKFSTETSTVASFDVQIRLVRRDGYNPVLNDIEGQNRPGWALEYHNLYLDLYNVFNPLLNDEQRKASVGHFNLRVGRFYVPFGLNLQTDTHGTVLQLSNERNFGFERDWGAGLWGSVNKHLDYDAHYLVGSGYDLVYKSQTGLGALRLSLSNLYLSQYGLEGGFSILGGQRLPMEASTGSALPHPIATERTGLDGRYRHAVPRGLLTFTTELGRGKDNAARVFAELHEAEYLHASRRWGVAAQYRRFTQAGAGVDASLIGEATWYFRNDVGNSNSHWIKLNVERQLERIQGRPETVVTLQYYFYR